MLEWLMRHEMLVIVVVAVLTTLVFQGVMWFCGV